MTAASEDPSIDRSAWRGPLPSPETMREYENYLPGSTDRLLNMVEKERAQQLEIELLELKSEVRFRHFALISSVFLSIIGIFVAVYLAMHGLTIIACVILGACLSGTFTSLASSAWSHKLKHNNGNRERP